VIQREDSPRDASGIHDLSTARDEVFRLLVESVEDYAIFMLDPRGLVATWNSGAERIKGYTASEIVGQHFSRFFPAEEVRSGKCERELDAAARNGRCEDEGWRLRKDGSLFWARATITAVRDRNGNLVGFAKVTRDMTASRNAEEERIRLAEMTATRESTDRTVALLSRLHSVAGSLAAARTTEDIARILVSQGAEAVSAPVAAVTVARDGRLEIVASRGLDAETLDAWRSSSPQLRTPAGTAFRLATPVYVEDPAQFMLLFPDTSPLGVECAVAALPLAIDGQVRGTVSFRFPNARKFDPEERALLQTMATQAAQAIDRARLYDREVSLRHRLESLRDLSSALSAALTLDDVARLVIDEGMRAMSADTCMLYTLDESRTVLELVAERGCAPETVAAVRRIRPEGESPVYSAAFRGEPLWVETPEQYAALYPNLVSLPSDRPRARAFWSAPLVGEGRLIGLLAMGFYQPHRFAPEEREFVGTFTRQCAEAALRAQRVEAERQARREAERLKSSLATTLHSIGDAVMATDERGLITMMNPVAEALTAWSEATARGRPLAEVFRIVNEETRAIVPSPVDKVLELGTVVGLANHTVLLARDGREVPIDDSGAPIRSEGGATTGVVLVFRDASAKKREASRRAFLAEATATLAQSLEYETTLSKVAQLAVPLFADWCAVDILHPGERMPRRLAVAHVDPAKVSFAREIEQRYPVNPDSPTGVPNVLRTGRSEIYREITDEMLVAGSVDEEHLRIARALGLKSAVVVPLVARGRTLGAVTFVHAESGRAYDGDDLQFAEDLARRCAVAIDNASLYAAEQRARHTADVANRAKDEFLAIVSHELRTPLNAILGWAKMMSAPAFDESRRDRALDTIERNAVAMAQLIEDLLDMSRIITGKMRIDVQKIEMSRSIEAAIESIQPAADAKGIRIDALLDRGVPPVLGDPTRLQQIVWNLLSNAVKFTPPGRYIEVRLSSNSSWVELSVKDTGRGIAPEFLPYVFDAFRQEEASHTRSRGGLGLGLAITRQLVELHGGRIEAHSEGEGKGSTFTVLMPGAVHARTQAEPHRGRPALAPGAYGRPEQLRGLRVLVVDDEEDARQLVRAVLEDCGCRVTLAKSVDEAMAIFESRPPDVLVSDIAMPERDGYELIRKVRAFPREGGGDVPAAALTAYARAEDRRALLNAGFSMHVPKPMDPAELVAVVASLTRFSVRSAPEES
jgi:PAS domain S-box-containing protein